MATRYQRGIEGRTPQWPKDSKEVIRIERRTTQWPKDTKEVIRIEGRTTHRQHNGQKIPKS